MDNRKPTWDEKLGARRGCCGSTGVRNTRNLWVVEVGVTHIRYVALEHARPWVIHAYRNIKGRGFHREEEVKGDEEAMQSGHTVSTDKEDNFTKPNAEDKIEIEEKDDNQLESKMGSLATPRKRKLIDIDSPSNYSGMINVKTSEQNDESVELEAKRIKLDQAADGDPKEIMEIIDHGKLHSVNTSQKTNSEIDKGANDNQKKHEVNDETPPRDTTNDTCQSTEVIDEIKSRRLIKKKSFDDNSTETSEDPPPKSSYDKVRLIVQPWRKPEGGINKPILKMMLESVMLFLMMNPFSTEKALQKRYAPYLQPITLKTIIKMLEEIGCIKTKYLKQPKCSLFSKPAIPEIGNGLGYKNVQTLTTAKPDNVPELDLDDYRTVFSSKSLWEILRALLVFKVCSYDIVVANSLKIMQTSKKLLGTRLYQRLMQMTIYGQFVGGSTTEEITRRVHALNNMGVGALLFIPTEEAVGDKRDENEIYDHNLQTVMECARLAKSLDKKHPMAQLKLTSLMSVELCKTISEQIPNPQSKPGYIDTIAGALDGEELVMDDLLCEEDYANLTKSLQRIKEVCELADSLDVLLWVDAEYTYLNPALRLISLSMMLKTNKNKHVVAYTYQNYLKETFDNLKMDIDFIASRNACFGAKLVRGAYMERERRLAMDHGYPDPVHGTFDDTSDMYHDSMTYLMEKVRQQPDRFFMIVASHNEYTTQLATQVMAVKNIPADQGSVFFGQVYGMSDYLSFGLGKAGYLIYKSIPFGTIDETIPYLHRRAMENKSVLGETRRERKILVNACLDRVSFGLAPFRNPKSP